MNVDKVIAPNSPEYYRAAADYDGVVLKARESLSGLTTDNLRKWYLACCLGFFFVEARWFCLAKRTKIPYDLAERARIPLSISASHRSNLIKLARRLISRLYVIRKMDKIRVELDNVCELLTNRLEGASSSGYQRAIDKSLYLAERLKWSTRHMLYEAEALEQARLGRTHFGLPEFEPTKDASKYCAWQLGFTMAHAHHFRQLLSQFDQSIKQATEAVPSQENLARLSPSVKLIEVRNLFNSIGMGSTYNKPGEWAAAIRALVLAGVLKGSGHEVARWAVNEKYIEQKTSQTVRKACGSDGLNLPEDFKNDAERRVFQVILDSASKILKNNKLAGK